MNAMQRKIRSATSRLGLRWAGVLLALVSFAGPAWARPGDAGRLLSYGSSARDVSLGGAVSAVPQGAGSIYWNPALLSDVSRKDVSFLQAQLFGKTSLNWMGYAHPYKQRAGTFALQIIQLKTQSGDKRNETNDLVGSFNQSEQVVGFGYGFHPTTNRALSLGLGFNMLKRSLGESENTLYGLNAGASYQAGRKLRSGLVLQNMLRGKQGDTEDVLPMSLRAGNSYEILNGFSLTGDLILNDFKALEFNVGTELSWKFLTFRAGRPSDGDFSFGFGLSWKSMRLDVAMANHRDLGASQVFSFGTSFGRDRNVTRRALADTYFKEAQTRLVLGDWAGAKEWMDRARKADSTRADIAIQSERLSGAWRALGFPVRRKAASEEQQRFLGTGEPARLIREGLNTFIGGGNDAAASTFLRQAMAHRPTDQRLADLTAYVEQIGKVKPDATAGMSPEEIVTLKLKKIENLFDESRYDDALKVCQELVKLSPEQPLARTRLGSIYYAMGDVVNARREYEKALQLAPDDKPLREFMKMQGWVR
jgi:tetratricopeptide (TPR) repeat protein